ncbi:hypothetical protein [Streptomyces levis]|uniref:hypothetical protein n=1 Tax=Streptomyces levis TaxID=285566 RepID=UPI003C7B3666
MGEGPVELGGVAGEPAGQFELGVGESQGAGQCPQDVGTGVSNALWWLPTIRAEDRVYDASDPGKTVPVDTFDIARVAAVALTQDGHAGRAYIINGPQAVTAREQVEILADVLGRTIEFVPLTPEQFAQHSIEQGTPADFAGAVQNLNELFRAGRAGVINERHHPPQRHPPGTFRQWCQDHADQFH